MNVASDQKKSQVMINIIGAGGDHSQVPRSEILIAEVSVKPFMSFVWIAAVFIIGGLTVAMFRRLN